MSDSHKNIDNVYKIVDKHKDDGDLFLHLGDGERDFDSVLERFPQLRWDQVCGNCDFYSSIPTFNLVKGGGKRIFFTHGHLYNVKYCTKELLHAAEVFNADIVLYGHTHVAKSEYIDGVYLVNPGSCSGMGASSYAIIDITRAGIVPIIVKL